MKQRLLVCLVVLLGVIPIAHTSAQSELCFNIPGVTECVDADFRAFWEANGGLPVFGYPTTPQYTQQTRSGAFEAQYFERNRLELHPENPQPYNVQLARLGVDVLELQERPWQRATKGQQRNDCLWFAETQHNVCGPFQRYWESHGLKDPKLNAYARSLALFGLPITEQSVETNNNGDNVLTQWFERARFEFHGDKGVLLGLLGNHVRSITYPIPSPPQQPAPSPPPVTQPLTGDMLYPCTEGLCTINLGSKERRVVVPLSFHRQVLYGYAKAPDGKIYFGVGAPVGSGSGSAVAYVANADGSNPRALGGMAGAPSGIGDLQGYGVLGVTPDNSQLLVEVEAQSFALQIQNGSYRAITPQLTYGASSGHILVPSPNRSQLMIVSSRFDPNTWIYRVSDGSRWDIVLDPQLSIAFWGRDENHVIAYKFDRPWDDNVSWGEMMERDVVAYVEVDLTTGQTQPTSFDPAFRPLTTGANGYIVLARGNEYVVYNASNNSLQPIALPTFSSEGDGKPMVRTYSGQ